MSWQYEALCTRTDPEIFFPDKGHTYEIASKICRACPVIDQCRAYGDRVESFALHMVAGTWGYLGGETSKERIARRLRQLEKEKTA